MKTVLVTGAAGGMGRAICRTMGEAGYRVIGLDLRDPRLPCTEFFPCDLTDPQAPDRVKKALGLTELDGIVHAAGIYDLDSLVELPEERFQRILQINLGAVYRINRVFTPLLSKGGRVSIITSELGPLKPLPFTGIYAVTKGALEKYAYSLRSELALRGIWVSVIRPGAVNTGLLGVSTAALDRFVENTRYYRPNAKRFYDIVNSVEARAVAPEQIGQLVRKAQTARRPRLVYNINRNPLLRILSAMPDRFQLWILGQILK